MPVNPNPQGKGTLPILQDLQRYRPSRGLKKTSRQVAADYFASLLVLSSEFRFRPVPGKCYHLYFHESTWQLSLIGPQEWGARRAESYVGRCRLQEDATWSVDYARDIDEKPVVADALRNTVASFCEGLGSQADVSAALPRYEARLPYYQRVLATALAASLDESLGRIGLARQSGELLLESAVNGENERRVLQGLDVGG